jgi:hypothetical protein
MMYHYKHSFANSANLILCAMIFISKEGRSMAKNKGGAKPAPEVKSSGRQNGKASKKRPKVWDPEKRKLVTKQN